MHRMWLPFSMRNITANAVMTGRRVNKPCGLLGGQKKQGNSASDGFGLCWCVRRSEQL
jgi:hypothetical protein